MTKRVYVMDESLARDLHAMLEEWRRARKKKRLPSTAKPYKHDLIPWLFIGGPYYSHLRVVKEHGFIYVIPKPLENGRFLMTTKQLKVDYAISLLLLLSRSLRIKIYSFNPTSKISWRIKNSPETGKSVVISLA